MGFKEVNFIFNQDKKSVTEIAEKYSFKTKEVKSILNKSKNKRSFFMEDYTLNPYMGCSFNCSYCYVNGSKYADNTNSYVVKSNAYELLKSKLKNKVKKRERAIINLGSASEAYMEIEKDLFLTRDILKLLARFRFPIHIITKSDLILRDRDILKKIQESAILPKDIKVTDSDEESKLKVIISFSFSTTDDKIAKIFEPKVPLPSKRLKAMKKLKKDGFCIGAALMPLLPFISDSEESLREIYSDFKNVGAEYAIPGSLSLFDEYGNGNINSKKSYFDKVKEHFPEYYEDTTRIFEGKNYLSNNFHEDFTKKIRKISKEYNIKTAIKEEYNFI